VIHGTSGLVVRDNVAFHANGHCFYLEDGVEVRVAFGARACYNAVTRTGEASLATGTAAAAEGNWKQGPAGRAT